MGLTYTDVEIAAPANPMRWESLHLLVDTGALFSIIPRPVLEALGVPADTQRHLGLADGSRPVRDIGEARFRIGGEEATSRVVFGEPGDAPVLGAVTLESLTLAVDPSSGELERMDALMAVGFDMEPQASHSKA